MYHELTIDATSSETQILLIDPNGHPAEQGTGSISTSVPAGSYYVAFGLRSGRCCAIQVDKDLRISQAELEASGTCSRPPVRFPGDDDYVEYDPD